MTTSNSHPPHPTHQPPQPPAGVPEGWYRDPQHVHLQRWWDGARWTEHTAPAVPVPQGSVPGGAGNPYDVTRDVATGRNTAGMWALGLGLAAVVFGVMRSTVWLSIAAAIAAIVWGGVGVARASQFSLPKGTAIAGLVIGVVALACLLLVWGSRYI